uniref:Uncharacterized protein n=1 Tax=Anguilla anguilla TaxID=7936 RepID=A0A0E9U547_ANGAN
MRISGALQHRGSTEGSVLQPHSGAPGHHEATLRT